MTTIKLHNTKTRKKEVFEPLDAQNVRMYVCGPTVYDRAHLGNARPVVVFDVLYRLLRHVYGPEHVKYVRNFTDVDDKINKRAAESGRKISEITDETIQWFLQDMGALGALEPNAMPRATEYIPQMVAMIEALIAGGHAYAAEGHVLFAVESYAKYGALSGRTVDDMIAGARVEVAPYKRNPMDFVLWKPSGADLPGWDSPWGRGRPGWHIECSAMSYELLGESFDIHGGGNDLMFPHHENEIAQSCCVHPKGDFAKVWMHNEMLQVEGKKMSKSLGNFFTVRDLLDGHDGQPPVPGEVIRFVFLSTHYRKPMDWTQRKAESARLFLKNLHDDIGDYPTLYQNGKLATELPHPSEDIVAALADDLNTHLALSKFKQRVAVADFSKRPQAIQVLADGLLLGFFSGKGEPKPTASMHISKDVQESVQFIIEARNKARLNKDYSRADELRDQLEAADIYIKDGPEGSSPLYGPNFDPTKLEALR